MADDVILNKATFIERCIRRIQEEYQGSEHELAENYTKQDAIVLNIQRACEAALDMATHVVRIQHLGVPQTSREVYALLAEHQIITPDLSNTLQKMVGFRNIAVHDYTKLEIDIIRKIIEFHLKDLAQFSQILVQKFF